MNQQERIQARIARSKARREAKRRARAEEHGKLEKVIRMQTLFKSLRKRRKGTNWKQSVMEYCFHAPVKIYRAKHAILNGELPEPSRIREIHLYERGKARRVHAVAIDSRVIQGAICDECITPLTGPGLIHDNPASTKGKGMSWARQRILRHMRRAWRKYGRATRAMVYDIRGFFDNIQHRRCRQIFQEVYMEERLIRLAMHFIRMYQIFDARAEKNRERIRMLEADQGVGVSLGSQISQDMALCAPNPLDHFIKDELGTKEYLRYMDDGKLLGDAETLEKHRRLIEAKAEEIGFRLHPDKTRIVKLTDGFEYLKIRYRVTDGGHIIRKPAKSGVIRARRRLKKLKGLWLQGRVTLDDIYNAHQSWMGNTREYTHSWHTRRRMQSLYYRLYRGYRLKGAMA